jgi:DNA-binding transcriptional LysR family regulator
VTRQTDRRIRLIKPTMDPQKLQHFLSVYDTGSFSRAAEVNEISQQAVSKSVAKLEAGLGVSLFERNAFGVQPTMFAHTLARRAKIITAETKLAAAELSALRGSERGYVRIGFGWSFLPRIAPMLIHRFAQRSPGITLSITSGDSKTLFNQMLRGEVEFVASAPPSELDIDGAIEVQPLFQDRDVIMMRHDHPLAGKSDVSLADLSTQTWLVSLQLTEQWNKICNIFLAAGLPPPERYVDLDSVVLAKSTLLATDSVALLGAELISNEVERPQFHTIEGRDFPVRRLAYLATRRNSMLQPAAESLKNDLVTVVQELITLESLRGIAAN